MLSLAFALFAMAVVASAAVVVHFETEAQLKRIVHRELQQNARQAAERVSRWIFERRIDALVIADAMPFYRDDLTKPNGSFADLKRIHSGAILWVGYVGEDCRVQQATDRLFIGQARDAKFCARAQKQPTRSYIHIDNALPFPDTIPDHRVITITHPVAGGGYVAIELRVSYLKTVLTAVPIEVADGHPMEIFIISKFTDQVVIGTTAVSSVLSKEFLRDVSDPTLDSTVQWPDGKGYLSGVADTQEIGEVDDLNWLVVTRAVEEDALTLVDDFVSRMVIWGFVICGASVIVGLFMARRLGMPLDRLTRMARRDSVERLAEVDGYREVEELGRVLARRFTDLQEAQARAEKDAIEREALLKEVHHRVKNNLQVIISLMRLQSSRVHGNPDGRVVLARLTNRVQVLGWLYSKLYERAIFESIDTHEIVEPLIQLIDDTYGNQVVIHRNICALTLNFDQTLVLGMIVIELVTNAVLHTAGPVCVSLQVQNGTAVLAVQDPGASFDPKAKGSGIGLTLCHRMAAQLGGSLTVTPRAGGGNMVSVTFAAV